MSVNVRVYVRPTMPTAPRSMAAMLYSLEMQILTCDDGVVVAPWHYRGGASVAVSVRDGLGFGHLPQALELRR